MRIAIVSDIHGNRTAFEAVLADLRQTSPDLILHGGDLADSGASPAAIVDRIRDLGWQGVIGNTDEMLFMPESLTEFANQSPKLRPLLTTIEEMATAIAALHTSCWMTLGQQSGAWNMTCTGSCVLLPVAAFPTPIGLQRSSKAAAFGCRRSGFSSLSPTGRPAGESYQFRCRSRTP